MGAFGSFNDVAFQLKQEGESIKFEFKQGVPADGQGTITWSLPEPAAGCDSGDAGAYAGMVILLSKTPVTAKEIPQNGTVYLADPTASFDLHSGDKIGSAIVVGAVYECDQKASGGTLTTEVVISDLEAGVSYYIAGYAADCQFRYHSDGVRAYSDEYGNGDEPDTPSMQLISFGQSKVLPTDGTDLAPGITYSFDLVVDHEAPSGEDFKVIPIDIDGLDALTYADLITQINNQIKLAGNPPQSPIPPNAGTFWFEPLSQKLYQFDGAVYSLVPAIIEATDPTIAANGTYWYDTTNSLVYLRAAGVWVLQSSIEYATDPRLPTVSDYWFDGTDTKKWKGTTWCETSTVVQSIDPSICVEPINGTYWFDLTNAILYDRNVELKTWEETAAVSWNDDPQALPDGSYWFDLNTSTLNEITTLVWADISTDAGVSITETEPLSPANGDRWYVPSTEVLSTYNLGTTSWDITPILVWPGDPTDTGSCDLWWDTLNDILYIWDSTNTEWDVVANFVQSTIDPAAEPIIVVDSFWFNTADNILRLWDGSGWEIVSYISHPTDPTIGVVGEVWHNTTDNTFFKWSAGNWVAMDPIESLVDPTVLTNGTYWFDTAGNALWVRNGVTWISVAYTTTPLIPNLNSMWYDTSTDSLYTWNGTTYVETHGTATAAINSRGDIIFSGVQGGSGQIVLIPVPNGANTTGVGCALIGSGYADFGEAGVTAGASCHYSSLSGEMAYPVRDIMPSGFLFEHLSPLAIVQQTREGQDGIAGIPSYDVIGVGDDGTPNVRRELADSLRAQLGHPIVTVELSKYQIDTAIQGGLESFRKRSSMAYKRGFFFLDIIPGESNYKLSNKRIGYDKIVTVTACNRFTSAFLSTAHGSGIYGQVVMQHLYNMGTYDLTSFHLMSQYVEQMEHLFATRIVFNWDEDTRKLSIFQSFTRPERMLLDCVVERTEQNLMKDRFAKSWIERYALSECQFILGQIRGKFASLPGAGGGVSLNASELISLAENNRAELMEQIDDYIVQDLENLGMHTTFIIG